MSWWWERHRVDGQPELGRLHPPGRSVYEDRFLPRMEGGDEDWHRVGERDPDTGAWHGRPDWSMGWRPFPGRRP